MDTFYGPLSVSMNGIWLYAQRQRYKLWFLSESVEQTFECKQKISTILFSFQPKEQFSYP